ncbi:uncharacterized protein LOC141639968 [Silene latifolia]|uniref:uncharacterized protein LOC141639968 n=1 Tax=Silene latifolia TaxID=37657 RepID=UPI003D77F84C
MARGRGRPPKSRTSSDSLLNSDSNGTGFTLSRSVGKSSLRTPVSSHDHLDDDDDDCNDCVNGNLPLYSPQVVNTVIPTPVHGSPISAGNSSGNSPPKIGDAIVAPSTSTMRRTDATVGGVNSVKPKTWVDVTKKKSQVGMSLFFHEGSANSTEIDIQLEEIEEEVSRWQYTLMGNVLGAKPTLKQVTDYVHKNWNHGPLPLVHYFKKGWFSFKFDCEEDMSDVLKRGPWSIGSNSLVLTKWSPFFSCTMESVSTVPVWVLFPDLDPYMWIDSVLSKMASKDFTEHVIIKSPYIGQSIQRVVYEWVPYYCKTCKKLGHSDSSCKKNRPVEPKEVVSSDSGPKKGGAAAPKKVANGKNTVVKKNSKTKHTMAPSVPSQSGPSVPCSDSASGCHLLDDTSGPQTECAGSVQEGVSLECNVLGSPSLTQSTATPSESLELHSGYSELRQPSEQNLDLSITGLELDAGEGVRIPSAEIIEPDPVLHCKVKHFATGGVFHLSVVYGSNSPGVRLDLWNSMSAFASQVGPWVAMGDFNVVRYFHEKISDYPPTLSDVAEFNYCLLDCDLDDMQGTGSDFNWFNKRDVASRVYSKLDRVLVNSDWMQTFTQSSAQFLPLGISYHCPAVLTFHNDPIPKKQFHFMNCWASHPDFSAIVARAWDCNIFGNPMFRLIGKLKRVRVSLRELHFTSFSNLSGRVVAMEANLAQCWKELRENPLSADLIAMKRDLSHSLAPLKSAEQQCQIIGEIHDSGGTLHIGPTEVDQAFVDDYKSLLGTASPVHPIDPDIIANGNCVEPTDCEILTRPISVEEIRSAPFSIGSNKSPCLDGFSAGFFKAAWDTVSLDFCKAVKEFFKSSFMPKQANVTMLSLIPKKKIFQYVKEFRPMSCCSIIYKTISKILTNRLQSILPNLVGIEQTVFVKNRSLFENIMLTQGLLKGYQRSYLSPRCMLKVDINKSFDSLQWEFIQNMLGALKFPPTSIKWIMRCITGSWFTININGSNHGFFKGKSGEQDVSFHPKCAKLQINHLVFADDLMIFTRGDLPSVRKAADILHLFSTWSGLCASFEKTEAYFGGLSASLKHEILSEIGLNEGVFPFRYLGIPVHHARLTHSMYDGLALKLTDLLHRCSSKYLSYADVISSLHLAYGTYKSKNSILRALGYPNRREIGVRLNWVVCKRYSRELLSLITSWTGITATSTQLKELLVMIMRFQFRKPWLKNWFLCCIAAAVYFIWAERNRRLFEGQKRSVEVLWKEVHFDVSIFVPYKSPITLHTGLLEALGS